MYLGEIQQGMVGQSIICLAGKTVYVADAIGPVQPIDVGKRVYIRHGVIQVENNEQRDNRYQ